LYTATDCGTGAGIEPLTKRAGLLGSDAVVMKDATGTIGHVAAMNDLLGGERKMIARLSGRSVKRPRSSIRGG
jgi:hypothetical protein